MTPHATLCHPMPPYDLTSREVRPMTPYDTLCHHMTSPLARYADDVRLHALACGGTGGNGNGNGESALASGAPPPPPPPLPLGARARTATCGHIACQLHVVRVRQRPFDLRPSILLMWQHVSSL